ncbi:TetR/AcrR family transcriptional regulator (plasmid) [Rhizobium bangladeshense]|jgi:TetR/AcrR family transcriptional repressor of nem operon|uniref:TetR/AcrR family transcriptional regulator n=1 Tax=Rhizobium bangladeshense TaxID=1138189 RepID=UPI000DD96A31|nr:TetR/AcrR family transcriptional regulator [Rhizobium bangladeshense]QSY97994.1 TetR/AcrR family transcriptional regulator [Rhizobium bangladeshense]
MRYDADHKKRTRDRVLSLAARQVREKGAGSIGVAAIMAEAGLTHGGFYAHFESKDVFLEAVVERMLDESPVKMLDGGGMGDPARMLRDFVDYYLSAGHRDTLTSGCPLPFLASEARRLGKGLSLRLARGVARMTVLVAGHLRAMRHPNPDGTATSCVSEIIGAMVLSRAEPDLERSDTILQASRISVVRRLGLDPKQ